MNSVDRPEVRETLGETTSLFPNPTALSRQNDENIVSPLAAPYLSKILPLPMP